MLGVHAGALVIRPRAVQPPTGGLMGTSHKHYRKITDRIAKYATPFAFFAFAQTDAAPHYDGNHSISGCSPKGGKDQMKGKHIMRKSIITVLAALSVSGMFAAPAAAEQVSVHISYADLNLASDAGTARLQQRIAAAVNEVCAKPTPRELKANAEWQKCKAATLSAAREALPPQPAFAQVAARF